MADNLLDNAREQNAGLISPIPSTEMDYAVRLINGLVRKIREGSDIPNRLKQLIKMITIRFAEDLPDYYLYPDKRKGKFRFQSDLENMSDYRKTNEGELSDDFIDADSWINKPNGMGVSPLQTLDDIDYYGKQLAKLRKMSDDYSKYANVMKNLKPLDFWVLGRKGIDKKAVQDMVNDRILNMPAEYDKISNDVLKMVMDRYMLDPLSYTEDNDDAIFGTKIPRMLINGDEIKPSRIDEPFFFDPGKVYQYDVHYYDHL